MEGNWGIKGRIMGKIRREMGGKKEERRERRVQRVERSGRD